MNRFRAYLRWSDSLPFWVRYGLAALMVIVAAGLRWILAPYLGHYPYMVFLTAVALSSMLLKGTGVFVALAGALVADYLFVDPIFTLVLGHQEDVIALFLFLTVSAVVVAVGENLHHLAAFLDEEDRRKDMALRELGYRTSNSLQIMGAILAVESARAPDLRWRQRLDELTQRLATIGHIQQRLYSPGAPEWVQAPDFLAAFCTELALNLVGQRAVSIIPIAAPFPLRRGTAAPLAVILGELITNAVRHAFPEAAASGRVVVRLERNDGITLSVSDNGVGCPSNAGEGVGTTLVSALAGQLGGSSVWEDAAPGCRAVVHLPAEPR